MTKASEEKAAAELEQFPSDAGQPKVEVAARTADTDAKELSAYKKTFVVRTLHRAPVDEVQDNANKLFVLQEAIQHGLHPTGEAKLASSEDHEDGISTYLHYSVAVEPAHTDSDANSAVTPTQVLENNK